MLNVIDFQLPITSLLCVLQKFYKHQNLAFFTSTSDQMHVTHCPWIISKYLFKVASDFIIYCKLYLFISKRSLSKISIEYWHRNQKLSHSVNPLATELALCLCLENLIYGSQLHIFQSIILTNLDVSCMTHKRDREIQYIAALSWVCRESWLCYFQKIGSRVKSAIWPY